MATFKWIKQQLQQFEMNSQVVADLDLISPAAVSLFFSRV